MPIQYQQETFDLVNNRFTLSQTFVTQAWNMLIGFINLLQNPTLYQPEFSAIVDNPPASIPNTFNYDEMPFSSTLMDELSAQITAVLLNGGTGLDVDVEAAIWARAQARQDTTNERTYNEALEFFAARGWDIPPGALGGRLVEALSEQTRAEAQMNYEIMIEQGRLAQKNTEFAFEVGQKILSAFFDYADKVRQRALDSAKASIASAVDIYKADVEKYKVRAELLIKEADANMRAAEDANALKLETIKAGANVAAQLAASAMSGTSVAAHLGYQGGYNYGFQESTQQSQSESYSESHNYQEK